MVPVVPVGSQLVYYINMLLGLKLCNSFVTWEGSLVGVSIGPLVGLIIGTGEGSLVGFSLGLPLGSLLESPNTGADLPGTVLVTPIGLWFGSETVSFL